ncbi:MAG: nucleotidyltransferase family protein [Candidatus Diapherotrites archaeon]
MQTPKKAFILAGGKGERLRPLTLEKPKPMLHVKGMPILDWNVRTLAHFGVKEIVLGVNYMHEKIRGHFGSGKDWGVKIVYSKEEEYLGTGGALKFAEKLLGRGRFVMLNGDNMMDIDYEDMLKVHERNNASGTLALVEIENPKKFGVVEMDARNSERITKFTEKPGQEIEKGLINAGAYILEPSVFALLPQGFSLIEKTAFPELAGKGKLYGFLHKGQFFATDDMERYSRACEKWKGHKCVPEE